MKDKETDIHPILLPGLALGVYAGTLWRERRTLERRSRGIEVRIGVTGTRGKTSVARLIGGAFREAGFSTLTKTTGSAAVLTRPDGQEEPLPRLRGAPTLLEWKRVLKLAEEWGVRVLVGELMSIRPESLFVETAQLLKPQALVVTNIRPDHTEAQGRTLEERGRGFAEAAAAARIVFIPEHEAGPEFADAAVRRGATVIRVGIGSAPPRGSNGSREDPWGFQSDRQLALAVSDHFGLEKSAALAGFAKIRPDIGGMKIWRLRMDSPSRTWLCVNLFAANDPVSTRLALDRLTAARILDGRIVCGILNLRGDRGDRTLQWLAALENRNFPELNSVVLVGGGRIPAARRLRRTCPFLEVISISVDSAAGATAVLRERLGRDAVILGLANVGGLGKRFIEDWDKKGEPYAV